MNQTRATICAVDDSPTVLSFISLMLRNLYRLKIFTSGKDFLSYYEKEKKEIPDLILLDVEMPEIDGYQVMREIKKYENLKDIPVIFLTAKTGEDYERVGLELGAVDYITKPFSSSILLTRIKNHLYIKRAKDELLAKNQELERLKNLYFELFDFAPVGYLSVRRNGEIIRFNQTFANMFGLEGEISGSINLFDLIDSTERDNLRKVLILTDCSEGEHSVELRLRRDSRNFYGLFRVKRLSDHFLVTITDTTELRETQRKSATYLEIIDKAPVSIVICNRENRIEYVNNFYCNLTGYCKEELLGKNPGFVKSGKTPPETYESLWSNLRSRRPWHGTFINKKKNGELFTEEAWIQPIIDDYGEITNYVAVKLDITEKLNLLEKQRNLMRAKSLISLSSGIAHHLNSINTPLLLISEYLSSKFAGQQEYERMLEIIVESVKKATELVDSIKIFSKNIVMMPKYVDISLIVKRALDELGKLIGENIKVIVEIDSSQALKLKGDEDMLKIAVMNLIKNAVEAMPLGGTLKIEGKGMDIVRDGISQRFFELTFSDTGVGISEEIRDRVFEPFFTTKTERNATGLGLSEVLGIVEQHGGFIELDSEVGKGTNVRLYLPID